MKKLHLLLLVLLFSVVLQAQEIFKPVTLKGKAIDPARATVEVKHLYQIDINALQEKLTQAPERFSGLKGVEIEFPTANGTFEKFTVYESSNFEPELQALYPEIRSYMGRGIDDPTAYLRLSVAPNDVQSMIRRAGVASEFIEPYSADKTVYVVFNSHQFDENYIPFNCQTAHENLDNTHIDDSFRASNQVYKQFRLALSCNGEYTTYHGGTVAGALAAMNATMTRVNGVYEEDLSVHLNIIANNTAVIYTNASTDPYTSMTNWNSQLQTTLTNVIGEANYDIGHMFGATGGGGNAGCIGCVCVDGEKGSGITSPANAIPQGDLFDIDYVAHEMGHQLGGTHTFSHQIEGSGTNVEPGGGTTIMAYAGITNYNVQMQSDDYFTYRSIQQIQNNLASKPCAVNTTITNQLPTVSVGSNSITIPKGTAFKLEGTATDPENNALTYCWEQNNSATDATTGANSICYGSKPAGPNFRSLTPVSTPIRYFPKFSDVLTGNLYNMWESVSDVARTMVFTLTVRDLNGTSSQTKTVSKAVTVSGTVGPFTVTYPAFGSAVGTGATINATWNHTGTNVSPINATNVKISLSTDNGATFTTLIASTPNDGSENITLPAGVSSQNAYLMIEAVENVFYTISGKFLIGYTATTNCNNYAYSGSAVTIPDGLGANVYGSVVQSTINVPALAGVVTQVKATVNVTHTYIQDLRIGVKNPQNTEVYVWNRQCASENNIAATFSDSGTSVVCASPVSGNVLPNQPLSGLNGNAQAGAWKLALADGYNGDQGTLTAWSLNICSTNYVPMHIADISFESFNLYPNPSQGIFQINLQSKNNEQAHIMLFDMSGRLVTSHHLKSTSTSIEESVDLRAVAKGIYILKIVKGNESASRQVVIE